MKILWLTNNRTRQVLDSFTCLREALASRCEVKSIIRPLEELEVDLCRKACDGMPLPLLVDPDEANAYDWIVCDAPWSFLSENWSAIATKKAVIWADHHGKMVAQYLGRFFHEFKFDLYLPLYRDGAAAIHSYIPAQQRVWLPVWVNTAEFRDWQLHKKYEVLLTGAVHPVVYQLRYEVWEQCNGKPWFTRIERPHYEFDAPALGRWPLGADFGRVLNSAHICVTCTSRFGYPIGKVFEIPACRSVLACDWCPEMRELGFSPFRNFLPLDIGGDQAKILSEYLERKDLQGIADAGYHLINTRHTAAVRAEDLLAILEDRHG